MNFLFFILVLLPSVGIGKTYYVIDIIHVPIRTGKTNGHRVIKVLKSGSRVEVLERDSKADMVKVKTEEGKTGWMKGRYLSTELIARDQLHGYADQAAILKKQVDLLTKKIKELEGQIRELNKAKAVYQKKNQGLSNQLEAIKAVSADVVGTHQRNIELQSESKQLQDQLLNLSKKNSSLKDNTQNEGIKLGVAAIMGGILLGLFLPYLKPRKKPSMSGIRIR